LKKRNYSTKEAAHYLAISEQYLKNARMKSNSKLLDAPKPTYLGCRRVVYLIEDLDAWIDSHKTQDVCDNTSAIEAKS